MRNLQVLVLGLFCLAARADVLVVASSGASHVTLIDPASRTVLAQVPVGKGPHEIVASRDGKYAWVADAGATSVTLVDLRKRRAVKTLELTNCGPHDVALPRKGTPLFVTCAREKALLEIDPRTGAELKRHDLAVEGAWMVAAAPDGSRAYTANLEGGGITFVERGSGKITNLTTSEGEIGIDVTPDGAEVWLANSKTSKVTVFDARSGKVLATFDAGAESPSRVRFTPDGKRAVMTFGMARKVGVFDVATRKLLRWIEIDSGSKVLTISPDGRRAAVSAPHKDAVLILDLVKGTLEGKVAVAGQPDGVAWAK
ncbi:MAG TPA: YncE family protein [Thermoanaerobaculia bacterium]|nr:YncE family protein [Thermoanaerobaculia bacterium]